MEISTIGLDLAKNIFQVCNAVYARMDALVSALGSYADVGHTEDLDQKPSIVGAVDDLTDIYSDMVDVVRYAENASSNEDTLHFRFGYQVHRGSELHNVRRYLATSNVAAW